MASTSISSFHAGLSSAATTMLVLAGRTSREELAVHAPDRREVSRVDEVDARANDVGEPRTGLGQRGADDLEAPAGLDLRVRVHVAVGPLRRRAGDDDVVADPHGPAVADLRLERGAGRDELAVLHGGSVRRGQGPGLHWYDTVTGG